jgi:hypothetical protein
MKPTTFANTETPESGLVTKSNSQKSCELKHADNRQLDPSESPLHLKIDGRSFRRSALSKCVAAFREARTRQAVIGAESPAQPVRERPG